jgi:hypothetical protein
MALGGCEWSSPWPDCLAPPPLPTHPLYKRLDGPLGQCGWVWKISPPLGFEPQTVQPDRDCGLSRWQVFTDACKAAEHWAGSSHIDYNMQKCEDPNKYLCLLAGLEGSPWSGTVWANKGSHTAGLGMDCLTCCCISGCRLHVPCRVFRSGTVLEWQDGWFVGGSVHHRSSGSKTLGVTQVLTVHYASTYNGFPDSTTPVRSHHTLDFSIALWEPAIR